MGGYGASGLRDLNSRGLALAPGRVNDLVLTLKPGASRAVLQGELRAALAAMSPPVSAAVTTRAGIASYRVLYDDIKGDEQLWQAIAVLVLAGAAFAALNLTTRIVAPSWLPRWNSAGPTVVWPGGRLRAAM